jgi:PST family polysaccharide transporter
LGELDRVAGRSARAGLHLFVGNLLSEFINAGGAVVVARLLAPGEYGVLSLAFVLPGIFVMFSDWGVSSAVTRLLARLQSRGRWSDVREVFRIGLLFNGVLACLLSAAMFLAADPLAAFVLRRSELGGLVKLTSILVVLQSTSTIAGSAFLGLERMDLMAAVKVAMSAVKALASSMLVLGGYGVEGAVIGHLLGTGTMAIASPILILWHSKGRKDLEGADHGEDGSLRGMLGFGFPLFVGNFLNTAGVRYRGLLLAWFADNASIGNLDIANKFMSLVSLFTFPIKSVLYPTFSKFDYHRQPDELKRVFRVSVRYATLIVVPAIALIMTLSGQLVVFFFGHEYRLAPRFLSLVLLQFLPVTLGALSVFEFLNSQGDTVTSLRLIGVNVGLTIALCTVLTWRLGVTGLLAGVFVSMMAGWAYNLHRLHAKYGAGIDPDHAVRSVLFSSISALISYASLMALDLSNAFAELALGSIAFSVACMFLAPLTGALTERDLENIGRILRRETPVYPAVAPFLELEARITRMRKQNTRITARA